MFFDYLIKGVGSFVVGHWFYLLPTGVEEVQFFYNLKPHRVDRSVARGEPLGFFLRFFHRRRGRGRRHFLLALRPGTFVGRLGIAVHLEARREREFCRRAGVVPVFLGPPVVGVERIAVLAIPGAVLLNNPRHFLKLLAVALLLSV